MQDENQFWLGVWISIIVGAVLIAIIIATTTVHSNRLYYQAYNECITSGGSWIPTPGNSNAVCLKR
jgi:hypothetical protein